MTTVKDDYNNVLMSLSYDADGARVKSVAGGTTTVYVGNHYEKNVSTGEVTKYYYLGGQRVAMRQSQTWNMETPSMGSGYTAYQGSPAGAEWSWGNSAGLTANNTAFTALAPNAPEGAQAAFIQLNGWMQRTVNTRAGQYKINLRATQRRNYYTNNQVLRVLVDGVVYGTFVPTLGATYDVFSTIAFTLGAGSHTIRIEGTVTTGDVTAFVDAVSLDAVTWLHSDHLGSASVATNATGGVIAGSDQRYTPFGSPRFTGSVLPSKYTFTGQRSFMDEIGTMDYGARQYSPLLGRFLSADSVVPGGGESAGVESVFVRLQLASQLHRSIRA